jgi:hypothetical protein
MLSREKPVPRVLAFVVSNPDVAMRVIGQLSLAILESPRQKKTKKGQKK